MSESKVGFLPAAGRYIVKQDEAEKVSPGGIHIPSSVSAPSWCGTIVGVGDDWVTEGGAPMKMEFHLGDHVLYSKFSGAEVQIGGVDYVVIDASDILGVFTE